MKKSELLVGIIGLVLIGFSLYFIGKHSVNFIMSLKSETLITLVSITIPLLASIFSIFLARRFENQKIVQEKLREKKVPVYSEFIKGTLLHLQDKTSTAEIKDKRLEEFLKNIMPEMMIWADDKSIKAWADFRTGVNAPSDDPLALIKRFEKIILAMREDLGHKNKNLDHHELLKSFLNDVK